MLCFPHGLQLEAAPRTSPPPVRYVPFALAGDHAEHGATYVTALVFYEPLDDDQLERAAARATRRRLDDDRYGEIIPMCVYKILHSRRRVSLET